MIFPTKQSSPELYPYRHGLYFSFFHALNWQVAIGTPSVLFLQHLGANSFQVGLLFSWTFLLTPAQVASTALLSRLGYKQLTMIGWAARSACLLFPLTIAILAPNEPASWMVPAMLIASFVYCLLRALGTSALTTWMYQLVPGDVRGRYWASDQLVSGIAIVGSLLVYALLFTTLPVYRAFIILYVIAIFGALMSYRQLAQLPDVERPRAISLKKVVTETPRLMFQPSQFRTYLWISITIFCAITPIAPFAAYYLKTSAGLGTASILLLSMLIYAGLIIANLIMRAKMDRIGAKPFFRLSFLAHIGIAIGWLVFLFTGGDMLWLMPILYTLQGFGSGCWNSANLAYLAKIVPENDRALPVSIHGAVMTFIGGCTPVLWGLILKGNDGAATVNLPAFEVFFVTLLVLPAILLYFVGRLPETAGSVGPIFQGAWVLRPFRAAAALLINLSDDDSKRPPGR